MTLRPFEIKVTRFVGSHAFSFLLMAIALMGALIGYTTMPSPYAGDGGPVFDSPDTWLPALSASFVAGVILTAAVAGMMEMTNRVFNLLRTPTLLFLGLYAVMQAATPLVVCRAPSGILLNLVVLSVLASFYTTYQRPLRTRRIFLSFCIMSALAMADYVYFIYVCLFLLAFGQMRTASARMYLAALMGIVTPWWITWGFGLMPDGIHMPVTHSIFTELDSPRVILMTVTVGITVIGLFLLCVSNMMKVYSYNAKARAMSGLLMMLSLATAIAALVNVSNAPAYLPVLDCFVAYQATLCFKTNEKRRGYIMVAALLLVYIIIYAFNIWIYA